MSSTILYKFRAGTTFEALPLPGSAARLFDIKKAIVTAKKLDQGAMEFDLSVRDATTQAEYNDDTMLIPRGTRLVVHRLPATKGNGLLAKIARSQYGISTTASNTTSVPGNFYTIDANQNEQDEFVSTEEKELAALRAATDTAGAATSTSTTIVRGGPAGGGRALPPPRAPPMQARPSADPELRDLQQQQQPKKRPTGIPRTFQGETTETILQPNTIGFEELKNRGGGQSESAAGTKRDLDYVLKVTATSIPEYLQCAICNSVVKDAMIVPWDPEGRTVCETCIRDAIAQNGFKCPLTGQEGVSPDDLIPNQALRKAAEQFVKTVMEKMDEIEKMQVDDDDDDELLAEQAATDKKNDFDADGGVLVSSKRGNLAEKKKKKDDDLFFGGVDEFGGDVFAVGEVKKPEENSGAAEEKAVEKFPEKTEKPISPEKKVVQPKDGNSNSGTKPEHISSVQEESKEKDAAIETSAISSASSPPPHASSKSPSENNATASNRRDHTAASTAAPTIKQQRPRGPPAGYAMGPAGGAVRGGPRVARSPRSSEQENATSNGDRSAQSRGGAGHGSRHDDRRQRDDGGRSRDEDSEDGRRNKRARSESEDHSRDGRPYGRGGGFQDHHGRGGWHGGSAGGQYQRGGGRGGGPYQRGGGGGEWDRGGGGGGRGGPYRGGRGPSRGGPYRGGWGGRY